MNKEVFKHFNSKALFAILSKLTNHEIMEVFSVLITILNVGTVLFHPWTKGLLVKDSQKFFVYSENQETR